MRMNGVLRLAWARSRRFGIMIVMAVLWAGTVWGAPYRVAVLMLGDIRQDPVAGLKDGLQDLGYVAPHDVVYEIKSAQGHRDRLLSLAQEIVADRPDIATAAGGVEADALKQATANDPIPVVFLAVASAVDRGLVDAMARPGGNLTGVDTNDTALTAKRLWLIRKMLPQAKRILIPNIPSITASVRTLAVAQAAAAQLSFQVQAIEGDSTAEIGNQVRSMALNPGDVFYMGMAAPVWQIEQAVFLPRCLRDGVPIMGINRAGLARGAMAAYACSRYEAGKQAARLVQKILKGASPADIPVETPSRLELVINRWIVERLGIDFPHRLWRMADDVVSIPFEGGPSS